MTRKTMILTALCLAAVVFAGVSYVTAQMWADRGIAPQGGQRGNCPMMQGHQQGPQGPCEMQDGPGMHRAQDMRMPMQNNMPPGPGNDGPNGMRRPPSEPFTQQGIEHSRMMLGLVHEMERACFSPQSAGMIALGSLKDDVQRKPEEVAADFEELLKNTKSLGLRNAIRLMLKDIYRMQNNNDKVLEHMRAMLAENDKAIAENPKTSN